MNAKVQVLGERIGPLYDWQLERETRLLEESQLRQLAITEATTDLVATIDIDGFLLSLNGAGHRMLGLSPTVDLYDLRLAGFMTPASMEQFARTDIPNAIQLSVWHSEITLRTHQGHEMPASQVLVAHRNDHNNVEFFSVVIRDIRPLQAAEHKRRQMLEQLHQAKKMETIGRLAGGIAHDFNNIITVIMGYAELALLNRDSASEEELKIILDASQKAARLTTQLLDFSSKNRIEPQVIDLNDVIGQSDQLVRSLMGEEIQLELDCAAQLWPIEIDRSQLEQIILNLAVNARDAIDGQGRFGMRTQNRQLGEDEAVTLGLCGAGDYVELGVSDTGRGIAREHLEHVFEPFFTTKGKGKGTGMGLSAVYGAIRQNKGAITVASRPGQGATFKCYFPRAANGAEIPQVVDDSARTLPGGKETILLVEDNADIRGLLATILREKGYQVLEADNGTTALQHFHAAARAIQLVISDVVMPKLDGHGLARRLRELQPYLKVMLMSGHTDQIVSLQQAPEPRTRLLPKPFQPNRLVQEVREFLDQD